MNASLKLVLIILFPILISCSSISGMKGFLSDGKPFTMGYTQNMMSDTYRTTIDGENFEGRAVMVDQQATFGTAFGNAFSSYSSVFSSSFAVGSSSGGKFKAILIGDKGSTLMCLMQYADPTGMTNFGGVGECVHSDKRTVKFTW